MTSIIAEKKPSFPDTNEIFQKVTAHKNKYNANINMDAQEL